jgi:hypothetical protein
VIRDEVLGPASDPAEYPAEKRDHRGGGGLGWEDRGAEGASRVVSRAWKPPTGPAQRGRIGVA